MYIYIFFFHPQIPLNLLSKIIYKCNLNALHISSAWYVRLGEACLVEIFPLLAKTFWEFETLTGTYKSSSKF